MENATVLVVEDDEELARLYATQLERNFQVEVATSGPAALDMLDPSTDIVLLDRRLPKLHGDGILNRIRESDIDCGVAMVTAVEPDFDIIELTCDDYLLKPVSPEELTDLVYRLLRRLKYDEQVRKYFALASKKATLETTKPTSELVQSDDYAELEDRFLRKRKQIQDLLDRLDSKDFRALFRELSIQ